MKKCIGCGVELQNKEPLQLGYTPKLEMDYCQRCFKMIHYDQHTITETIPLRDLSMIADLTGNFVWIVDIMDFEASMNSLFVDFYRDKDCIVIVNKCDLLPKGTKASNVTKYVSKRLKEVDVHPSKIFIRGLDKNFVAMFRNFMQEKDEQFIMTGVSNVGKSSIINEIIGEDRLTVNRHPSTTLQLNTIETDYGIITDSVGLVEDDSVQSYLKSADLKKVVPNKPVNPLVYQLNGWQSLAIAGLARVDIKDCQEVTAVLYVSSLLKVERHSGAKSDEFWRKHYPKDLTPNLKGTKKFTQMKQTTYSSSKDKVDICIAGVGWICISGTYNEIVVYTDKRIGVYRRKAMI